MCSLYVQFVIIVNSHLGSRTGFWFLLFVFITIRRCKKNSLVSANPTDSDSELRLCYFYRAKEKIKITVPDPLNIFARPELFVNCSAFLGRYFIFVFSSLKVVGFIIFRCRVTFIEKRTTNIRILTLNFGSQVKRTMTSMIVKTKALMSRACAADMHLSKIA